MKEDEFVAELRRYAPDVLAEMDKHQAEGLIATRQQAIETPEPLPVLCPHFPPPIHGSAARTCGVCFQRVWIAPSTQTMLRERSGRPTLLVCFECAIHRTDEVEARLDKMRTPGEGLA